MRAFVRGLFYDNDKPSRTGFIGIAGFFLCLMAAFAVTGYVIVKGVKFDGYDSFLTWCRNAYNLILSHLLGAGPGSFGTSYGSESIAMISTVGGSIIDTTSLGFTTVNFTVGAAGAVNAGIVVGKSNREENFDDCALNMPYSNGTAAIKATSIPIYSAKFYNDNYEGTFSIVGDMVAITRRVNVEKAGEIHADMLRDWGVGGLNFTITRHIDINNDYEVTADILREWNTYHSYSYIL